MRKSAALLLALLLALCAGCSAWGEPWDICRVVAPHYREGAELVRFETVNVPEGAGMIDALIEALNSPTEDPELQNPLPEDGKILDWRLSGTVLELSAGEGYALLAGLDKTLCDCCLALTLCGAEGVESISVSVNGTLVTPELGERDIVVYDAASDAAEG